MNQDEPAIRIDDLTKSYGRKRVLERLSLSVPRGSIFGFVGLNGAGKTTTIRCLLGLDRYQGGECRVLGLDAARQSLAIRQRVGYMAESQKMYDFMTVKQIIHWVGRFYPTWDDSLASALCEQMQLPPTDKVGVLSKGQTSKLALLLALAHRPELVILDDPTLGLDPIARRDFMRDVIGQLQSRGVTVFFSSHLLYEIEPVVDWVCILHEGKALKISRTDALRESVKSVMLRPRDGASLAGVPGILDVQQVDRRVSVVVEDLKAARPALDRCSADGLEVADLNLDEIFEAYVIGRRELAGVGPDVAPE